MSTDSGSGVAVRNGRPAGRWRLAGSTVMALGALLSSAGPAQAAPVVLSARSVPGASSLDAVACWAAASCVAVGTNNSAGVVVPIVNGKPGQPQVVQVAAADGEELDGVACGSGNTCWAVGGNDLVRIVSGKPAGTMAVPGISFLDAIACERHGRCFASGASSSGSDVLVAVADGLPGHPVALAPAAGTAGGTQALSCWARGCAVVLVTCTPVRLCRSGSGGTVATKDQLSVVTVRGAVVGRAVQLPPYWPVRVAGREQQLFLAEFAAIGCHGTGACVGLGTGFECNPGVCEKDTGPLTGNANLDVAVPLADGQARTPEVLYGGNTYRPPLSGMACPAPSMCLAVGSGSGGGALVPFAGTVPGAERDLPGAQSLSAVACGAPARCVAVGLAASGQQGLVVLANPK
jgi:hypothetical protein